MGSGVYSALMGDAAMKRLPVVLILCAWPLGNYIGAQDAPAAPKPPYTSVEMRKRISGDIPVTCLLAADKTEHLVNRTVTVAGKTYRCVSVLDEHLTRVGAAWTPVSPEPANAR